MKAGQENGKLCIYSAELPITIEATEIEGGALGYNIKELNGEAEFSPLFISEDMGIGAKIGFHCRGFVDYLREFNERDTKTMGMVTEWAEKFLKDLIRALPEEDRQQFIEKLKRIDLT